MNDRTKILFTGGSGLLGSTFRRIEPNIRYPTSGEFDITDYSQMKRYIEHKPLEMIIHAAAFTSPPLIDKNP